MFSNLFKYKFNIMSMWSNSHSVRLMICKINKPSHLFIKSCIMLFDLQNWCFNIDIWLLFFDNLLLFYFKLCNLMNAYILHDMCNTNKTYIFIRVTDEIDNILNSWKLHRKKGSIIMAMPRGHVLGALLNLHPIVLVLQS